MAKDENISEFSAKELTALIERVEYAIEHDLALSVEDMKLLLCAITTLCTLQQKIEQDDVTLHKLRKLLGMVKQSERRSKQSVDKKHKREQNKKSKNRKATDKPVPVIYHPMTQYEKGQSCPDCMRGKLYKYEPGKLLRITGHAPYEAIQHITEQLRCNACQHVYKATLPEEVLADGEADQQYGYSARTLMVIDKFYSGLPYYHQSNLATIFGHAISASTVFDQCEYVANAIMPIFYKLHRLAADASQFLLDDTHNRILTQQSELRDKPNGKGKQERTGVYSSGLIAVLDESREIVLFETSLGHAGEHLDKVLKNRNPKLPAPLIMSDALSSNTVTSCAVISACCNAHARRPFFDLELKYPDDVKWLLETYSIIWKTEDETREKNFDKNQRLIHHQTYSLPAMECIRAWALAQQGSSGFEEHSAMGKAINYFVRHYERLIVFCKVPGALIDNNRMEEKLKIIIRGRKTSHFYKTVVGAGVANVLISIIATAYGNGTNLFDYLLALQKNQAAVQKDPGAWLPWNYEDTLRTTAEKLKPDKAA